MQQKNENFVLILKPVGELDKQCVRMLGNSKIFVSGKIFG